MQGGRDSIADELPVWPHQVAGGKYVRLLGKFVQGLRDEDSHGNRLLFLDDVFIAYLLAFYTPTVRSLRTIEDFSQTKQAQKHLSVQRLCKSTLSDFHRAADPQRLEPIIDALRRQLDRKQRDQRGHDGGELLHLLERTVAVDGTFLPAAADVAWAVCNSNSHGSKRYRARLDCQLQVTSWLPEAIVLPEPRQSEGRSAAEHIEPGRLYLYDRGYSGFALINAHYEITSQGYEARSDFVIRYKRSGGNSPELQEPTDRELTDADRAAGVLSDRTGHFRSSKQDRHTIHPVPLREVIIEYQRGRKTHHLRLITNLLDVPAKVIGDLYKYRWQVELFFRWLKCFGNFDHLISHSREGVLLNFYVVIIAALLMYLHTGHRPSKYLFVLMSQVASGGATFEEVMPILRERERRCELERQSAARRRAKKRN